jgi:hypothetical protein
MKNVGNRHKNYATIAISVMLFSALVPWVIGSDTYSMNANAEPPVGYNHRPINEFFTSLSCPPCMSGTDQAHDEIWLDPDWGQHSDVRYTWVVMHTNVGGAGDDPFVTDEGIDRCIYYYETPGSYGSPLAEFDGGYRQESGGGQTIEGIKTDYDESGDHLPERQAEIFVTEEFIGSGIQIDVQVHYLGGDPGIDNTPTVEDIDATLYVFVIEDNIWAWSSYLNEMYLNHNVYREYAIEDDQFTLVADEWYNTSVEWSWPDPQPQVPINPGEVTVVAALYDREDVSSGENNAGAARASASSSPKATSVDWDNSGPTISNIAITDRASDSLVSVDFSDVDDISSAWLVYNNSAVEFEWDVIEMDVDSSGHATASFSEADGDTINYYIVVFDGTSIESRTEQLSHTILSSDDTTPPGTITDFVAEPGSQEGMIDLTWTATGDDDHSGTATRYYIRYATTEIISESNWDSAIEVTNPPTPNPAQTPESLLLEGLSPGQTFFFAIRAQDEVMNMGQISNSPSATVPVNPGDTTPPSKISDLWPEQGENFGEVLLTWTAPGDDGYVGTAQSYIIRYSLTSISTETDWDNAQDVDGEPIPKLVGEEEEFTITGLEYGTRYYFAVRAVDDSSNIGPISNSPWIETTEPDTTPPGKITDLDAEPGSEAGSIDLEWTAPGDDGWGGGKATKYYIRYSYSDIEDESDWDSADDLDGVPTPKNPGSTEKFTVTGLLPNTGYYFAIRAEDEVPNLSDISLSTYAIAADEDLQPPDISDVYHLPTDPTPSDEITFYATVTGDVNSVKLSLCKEGETCNFFFMEDAGSDSYKMDMSPLSEGNYEYEIMVVDSQSETYYSDVYYFTVELSSTVDDNDGDGVKNEDDAFPDDPTQWVDGDSDGYGDNPNGNNPDAFPNDETQWEDSDGDGYGDNPDGNNPDAFPNDSTQYSDKDGDGYGDNPDGNNPDAFPDDPGRYLPAQDTGSDTPWYEQENAQYMIILLIIVIIICAILAGVFAGRRKKAETIPQTDVTAIPVSQVIMEPVVQPMAQPVAQPMIQPTAQPVTAPVQEPVFAPVTMPQYEDISCPKCYTVFGVPTDTRPIEVQCPNCGTKGIID